MAWLGTWAKRIELTVSAAVVDATLTDFPVMVKLSAASGIGDVDASPVFDELTSDANRKKIAVTSSDGTTQLYCEIEKWDDANELAWLHIKVPSISSSVDTIIYLYYDSAQSDNTTYIGDTTDAVTHNVWDSNFKAVYHMGQDPNGDAANAIKDSTSGGSEGTPSGSMTTADLVDGQVGKGIDFDGGNDYITFTDDGGEFDVTDAVTIEAVVNRTSHDAGEGIVIKTDTPTVDTYGDYALICGSNGTSIYFMLNENAKHVEAANSISNGAWTHLAGTYDKTNLSIYADGVQKGTDTWSTAITTNETLLNVGIYWNSPLAFPGIIDEVRISSTARSAAWIKATYNSLWDSLITFGSAEADPSLFLEEGTTLSDTFSTAGSTYNATLSEGTGLGDSFDEGVYYEEQTEAVSLADTFDGHQTTYPVSAEGTSLSDTITGTTVYDGPLSEGVGVGETLAANKQIFPINTETPFIYDTLNWQWIKSLTSTAAIADTVDIEVGISVSEWLTANDTAESQWSGSEAVTSSLGMFGNALVAQVFNEAVISTAAAVDAIAYLHRMISVAESTLSAVDTASSKATFNPLVAESVAVAGTLSLLLTINQAITESPTITDTAQPGWLKTISDGGAIVDAAAIQWTAMHILTESLVATDTAIGLFNFNDTVSETFEAAAAVTIQQMLQASVTDILNFGITISLDGELWETWVMNSNKFNFSVYSNFDFNSYCSYGNQSFGCREDGIYRLDGATDNDVAFNAGIVLPETTFGTSRKKRFRKAYFGLSGDSPAIRMETDSGNTTYSITSSKASLSRSQYGKEWVVKVQGYDDMDFVELIPIILTR